MAYDTLYLLDNVQYHHIAYLFALTVALNLHDNDYDDDDDIRAFNHRQGKGARKKNCILSWTFPWQLRNASFFLFLLFKKEAGRFGMKKLIQIVFLFFVF